MDFGFEIGFIEYLQIISKCSYTDDANSHNVQFTTKIK
jgi:hypothetical protein